MPAYKIASGDLKNMPLLTLRGQGRQADDPQHRRRHDGRREPGLRHDHADQPAALHPAVHGRLPGGLEELDLRVITTFRERFPQTVVGLSAHDNGIAMAVAAYMLGARVVEKHFTLNRTWKGTDHAFSLEPIGFRKMVRDLKRMRVALGDGVKQVYDSEVTPMVKMGKKLVAARDLPAGHVLRREDIAIKSPGGGLPPYELDKVVGRVTERGRSRRTTPSRFEALNGPRHWKKAV